MKLPSINCSTLAVFTAGSEGDFFEHAAHAVHARIGLGRSDARIIIVSFLGDGVVADAQKLLDHLNTFHLVRPVKSDPFDEGAQKAKDDLWLLAYEAVGRSDVVMWIGKS